MGKHNGGRVFEGDMACVVLDVGRATCGAGRLALQPDVWRMFR